MKKLLTIILTLTLVLGLGTIAFAAGTEEPTYVTEVDLNKMFNLTNEGTISPEETFSFEIAKVGVTDSQYTDNDMPIPTFNGANTIAFAQGDASLTKSLKLTLPTYEHVGIFTYKITENIPNLGTAGVTYDETPIYLKVTAVQTDEGIKCAVAMRYGKTTGDKMGEDDGFTNTFSAGSLKIAKNVTGNMGEKDRYFKVAVTLTGPEGKNVANAAPISINGGSNPNNPTSITIGAPADFYLKHGETITLGNIPYGVSYTVLEEDVTGDDYDAADYTYTNDDKKINKNEDTVTITNNKGKDVDTGINLDNLPYMIILAVAIGGLALFTIRRRASVNK